MITPIAWIARRGRRATWAAALSLAAAGLLAAGCGSAQVAAPANGGAAGGTASSSPTSGAATAGGAATGGPATGAPATGGPTAGAPSGAGTASATPVPTVSGGPVAAGQPACAGWPAKAPTASLPLSFVPVSVERCVNGAQSIPGKGLWVTATLQRADRDLTGLIYALHRPPAGHQPGKACPAIAMIPPQIVLTDAQGRLLIPRLPATGCALTQSLVLVELNALKWHPVSVRLISQIPDGTAPAVSGSPHSYQTLGGVAPQ